MAGRKDYQVESPGVANTAITTSAVVVLVLALLFALPQLTDLALNLK
ncbi:hypothetical protein [Pseudomonas sp. Marseille-Q5115]|nr:hypothetical protein [Pseudomonas sp. Marseille-Q5115]